MGKRRNYRFRGVLAAGLFSLAGVSLAHGAEDRYWLWAAAHFGYATASNPAAKATVWGENADPDHDNLPNLVEYTASTDPLVRTPLSDVSAYQPVSGPTPASYPVLLSWQRTDDPDLAIVCQSSADLVTWSPAAPGSMGEPIPLNASFTATETGLYRNGLRQMRYQDKAAVGNRSATFMRVCVVRRNVAASAPGLEPFSFTAQPAVPVNGVVRSNSITLGGFTGTLTITIPAGVILYVNGVAQTGATASVKAGDVLWMQASAGATAGVARTVDLTIGSVSASWSFTTAAIAPVPVQPGVESGFTPVVATVSATGAAQISLPVVSSPGTGGMQPNLEVNYSSHASSGVLGLGFSLSGLSTISRVAATVAQDGFKGGIAFNANDRYALDGHRLIAISGVDGGDGAEYRLEFDPGVRIRSYGVEGSGPQRWTVETAAGQTLSFGAQAFARVKPVGCPSANVWAVDKITDPLGNAMDMTYDDTARQRGELLLTRIAYTSNSTQGLTAKQEVLAEYEDRPEAVPRPVSNYLLGDPGTFGQNQGFPSYWYFRITNPVPAPYIYQFYITGDLVGPVGGGTPYTAESNVSTAAVHAGILTAGQSGVVTIKNYPFYWPLNTALFPGSTKNGVTSSNANSVAGTGFEFLTTYAAPQPQAPTSYVGGYAQRHLKRLHALESKAANALGASTRVRRYDFNYQQDALSGESELASVLETRADGSTSPLTTFTWPASSGTEKFLKQSTPTGVPTSTNGDGDFLPLDFDGDDRTDLLVWNAPGQSNRFSFYRSNGAGFDAIKATSLAGDSNTRSHQLVTGDFNADGKSDLLVWDQPLLQYKLYLSTGADFAAPVNTAIPAGDVNHPLWSADFNGDGRTDILAWNYPGHTGKYVLLLSQGASFAAPVDTNITTNTSFLEDLTTFVNGQNMCMTGEFNGDGKADVLLWNATALRYDLYLSNGAGFAAPVATAISTKFYPHAPNVAGDFNGDGLTDIMVWGLAPNASAFTLYCATGNGFAAPIPTSVMGGADGSLSHYQFALDLNGDGKTDMMTWSAPFGNNLLNIETSTGAVFNSAVTPALSSLGYYILTGDFNGDGKTDLLTSTSSGTKPFNLWLNEGPPPRLVQQVTNGHGGYTKFTYKTLTDPAVHSRSQGAVYPAYDMQTSMDVVSSMTSRNGIDGDPYTGAGANIPGESTTNYTWYGALSWLNGRGFQGFHSVLAEDTAAGTASLVDYSLDPLLPGRPTHSEQRLITPPAGGSALISARDVTWTATPTVRSGKPNTWLITETGSVRTEYETNRSAASALVKTTMRSNTTYDSFGNLTHSLTSTGGFAEEATNTWNNYTGSLWLTGRLATSTSTRSAPGVPNIVSSSSYGYNAANGLRTSETVEPGGGNLRLDRTLDYDGFGNPQSATRSAAGEPSRTTSFSYSTDGRFLLTSTNAAGHAETMTYDPVRGALLSRQGPNGLAVQFEYDGLNRPVREVRGDGTELRTAYRLVTGATASAPPRAVHYTVSQSSGGAPRTTWLDLLGREIRTDDTGFDGQTVSVHRAYDARGNVIGVSQPYFTGATPLYSAFSYDGPGRRIREVAPGNRISTTTYDGLTVTATNPKSQSTVTISNVAGQTVKVIDAASQAITRSYDATGNLRFATDSAGNVTEMRYDARGNKTWMSEPNSGVSTFSYNAYGEQTSQTDAKGQTTTLVHDTLGRVTRRTEPLDGTVAVSTFVFDSSPKGIGQMASESGPGFSRAFYFDAFGRPAGSTETHGPSVFLVSRSYDQYGRPAAITYPSGFSVRRMYNASGLLESVTDAGGTAYWRVIAATARGQITAERLGNGVDVTRAFDPETGLLQTVSGTGGVQNEAYTFDRIGNLTQRQDLRQSAAFTETFTYDDLNRITNVSTTGAPAVVVGLDAIGNINSRSDLGSFSYASGAGPHAVTSIASGGSGVRNFAHDANGNRISDGAMSLTYNSANQPVRINLGQDSLRLEHTPARALHRQTLYKGEGGGLLHTVRDYVGGIYEREITSAGVVRHRHYIAGSSGMVAIYTDERGPATSTTRLRYLHKDHLGSVAAMSDAAGAVTERQSFDCWGRRRNVVYTGGTWQVSYPSTVESTETPRGFTGHEMLEAAGLVHMGGRVYDPAIGRFLSPDPIVQAPDNQQSYNRYSYVLNNACSYSDPTGFDYAPIYIQQVGNPNSRPNIYIEQVSYNSPSSGIYIQQIGPGAIYSPYPSSPSNQNVPAFAQTIPARGTPNDPLGAVFVQTNSRNPVTVTHSSGGRGSSPARAPAPSIVPSTAQLGHEAYGPPMPASFAAIANRTQQAELSLYDRTFRILAAPVDGMASVTRDLFFEARYGARISGFLGEQEQRQAETENRIYGEILRHTPDAMSLYVNNEAVRTLANDLAVNAAQRLDFSDGLRMGARSAFSFGLSRYVPGVGLAATDGAIRWQLEHAVDTANAIRESTFDQQH